VYLEIAQIDVKPNFESDFELSVSRSASLMEKSDGCISFELRRSLERPSRYRMLIMWRSIDAHMAFRESADARTFAEILGRCASYKESDHNILIYPKT
jgi:heme-degrading monooxygenase HmoA